jgi:hypothetical protein
MMKSASEVYVSLDFFLSRISQLGEQDSRGGDDDDGRADDLL